MAENTSRNVFGLHGVTGMLIATVLLLSIMVFLWINAVAIQQREASNYYSIDNPASLEFKNAANVEKYKLEKQ